MGNSNSYIPNPENTDHIELPEMMLNELEFFARNVHEEWACKRIDEGWRYGQHRDDRNKLHPSLIPYEDLPEEEKDYDRLTAISTIKMVIAMGHTIT
jgi:hypothetical protein